MDTTTAAPLLSLTFDTQPCDRCCGTGFFPYAINNGRCFKCSGTKVSLTTAGRRARKAYSAFIAALPTITAGELTTGTKVYDREVIRYAKADSAPARGHSVLTDGVMVPVECVTVSLSRTYPVTMAAATTFPLYPGADAVRAWAAKRSGVVAA